MLNKNLFIFLSVLIAAAFVECAIERRKIKFEYKKDLKLDCTVLGPEVEFYCEAPKQDVAVTPTDATTPVTPAEPMLIKEVEDKTMIENSTLTIFNIKEKEIKCNYYCISKNNNNNNRIYFDKQIAPFLYKPEKQSQTVTEGGSVEFSCSLLYGVEKPVVWTWTKNNSDMVLDKNNDRVKIVETNSSSKLTLKDIKDEDKGSYICKAETEYGSHQEIIQLRVKDTLAALWPFLGIVGEVILLCLIILIYEKRCNKKTPTTEEENEQAQNLMGKDGHNSDVKKRNAKA